MCQWDFIRGGQSNLVAKDVRLSMSNAVVEALKPFIGLRMDNAPSAPTRWLQGILREVGVGSACAEFTVLPDFLNPGQVLHGGVIALMFDEVMGLAVYTLARPVTFTPNTNLSINFLDVAREGDQVLLNAQVVRSGRRTVYVEASLTTPQGRLLAKASAQYIDAQS
jgi:acyl-CoA thioesterase